MAMAVPRRGTAESAGRFAMRRRRGAARERASLRWAVTAWVVGLLAFFPVLLMLVTGFKSEPTAVDLPPRLLPAPEGLGLNDYVGFEPTLEQYRNIFRTDFRPFFVNSALVSLATTALVMLLAVPAAYALALHPPKKAKDVLFFFISTKFLPPAGVIVPLFILYSRNGDPEFAFDIGLDLLGTMRGLIILYTAMNLPIAIWMLRSFFEEIPRDVLEAARLDGAGLFREMGQIVLPMTLPGLVATMFLSIIFAWNEFFFAVSLAAAGTSTVPIFMVKFVTSEGLFWAQLAATSTMAVLPIVLLGWAAQRQLVRGLSMGAVK